MTTSHKRPANAKLAMETWRTFIGKRLNGRAASHIQHKKRMETICTYMSDHFQIDYQQYQVKHVRSFLDFYLRNKGLTVTQVYFRTIYQMCCLMNKDKDWLPLLKGPWLGEDGQFLKKVIENERLPNRKAS